MSVTVKRVPRVDTTITHEAWELHINENVDSPNKDHILIKKGDNRISMSGENFFDLINAYNQQTHLENDEE